jgi:hypothetical protein
MFERAVELDAPGSHFELGEQGCRGPAGERVTPVRIDLAERDEHEGAEMEPRMRQMEIGSTSTRGSFPIENEIADGEEIQIDHPGSPPPSIPDLRPAEVLLDTLEQPEQLLRIPIALGLEHGVEVGRFVGVMLRRRLIDMREPRGRKVRAAEAIDGKRELPSPVSEVAPESDPDTTHRLRSSETST